MVWTFQKRVGPEKHFWTRIYLFIYFCVLYLVDFVYSFCMLLEINQFIYIFKVTLMLKTSHMACSFPLLCYLGDAASHCSR